MSDYWLTIMQGINWTAAIAAMGDGSDAGPIEIPFNRGPLVGGVHPGELVLEGGHIPTEGCPNCAGLVSRLKEVASYWRSYNDEDVFAGFSGDVLTAHAYGSAVHRVRVEGLTLDVEDIYLPPPAVRVLVSLPEGVGVYWAKNYLDDNCLVIPGGHIKVLVGHKLPTPSGEEQPYERRIVGRLEDLGWSTSWEVRR